MKYIEYINKQNALNYLCNIAYEKGLSVNDLIDGIADKGNVSRMRSGKAKVTLDIIMLLANRLDVNLEDVLRNSSSTDPDFFEAVDSIRYYSQIHDYEACKYLLKKTKKEFENEILKSVEIYQLIHWHEAIVLTELDNKYYEAIDILNDALAINNKKFSLNSFDPKDYSDIEIGIINSILISYFNIDKTNQSIRKAYKLIIEYLDEKHTDDYEILCNIHYEFLMVLGYQNSNVDVLLQIALSTAQLAIENGITNKLAFIYFQTALLYTDSHQFDKAEEYFNSSIFMLKQIKAPKSLVNSFTDVKYKCLSRK